MVRQRGRLAVRRNPRFRRRLHAPGQPCGAHQTSAGRGSSRALRETAGDPNGGRGGRSGGQRRAPGVSSIRFTIGFNAPICLKISALIAEGAIGAVRSVSWRTLRTEPAVAATSRGRQKLARRSGDGGRRHPLRSRLACALLRRPLGRRSAWRGRAPRNAPLPRMAARGHGHSRPGSPFRQRPHLPDLDRERALQSYRDRGRAGQINASATRLRSDRIRPSAAWPVRRPCRKDRIIPIGLSGWPSDFWLR